MDFEVHELLVGKHTLAVVRGEARVRALVEVGLKAQLQQLRLRAQQLLRFAPVAVAAGAGAGRRAVAARGRAAALQRLQKLGRDAAGAGATAACSV